MGFRGRARSVIREEDASQDATRAWRVDRPMELEDRKERKEKERKEKKGKGKRRKGKEKREGKREGKGRKEKERKVKEKEKGRARWQRSFLGGSTQFRRPLGRSSCSARVPEYYIKPPPTHTRTKPHTDRPEEQGPPFAQHCARLDTTQRQNHKGTDAKTLDTLTKVQRVTINTRKKGIAHRRRARR